MPSLENLSAPSISEQSPQRVDAPSMTSTIASAIQGISSAVGSARESSLARERFEFCFREVLRADILRVANFTGIKALAVVKD